MPTLVAATKSVTGIVRIMSLLAHLVERQHQRDERAGDRRRARAAVGLNDVAVERDRPLAELLEPRHRAQRAADQALNLLRAAADLARRRLRAACASSSRAAACRIRR